MKPFKDLILRIKTQSQSTHQSWKTWAVISLMSGVVAIVWDLSSPSQEKDPHAPEPIESAATYIPAGFVLVPIEVENYEAVDSILGKQGVVDLYRPSDKPHGRPRKVASRVRILRAPLNPSHFAVLAPENESQGLVAYSGAYTVAVQNPEQSGTEFEKPADGASVSASPKRSRIFVEVNDES